MYEIFEQLLKEHGISAYKVAKETGVTQTALSNWKSGRSTPSTSTLQKIADYFNVTIDYLLTGEKKNAANNTTLGPKDERDIAKRLEETLLDLENYQDALMFSGEPLDEETKELLKASLENSLRIAKINAKQKFTPKKYKDKK